MSPFEGESLLGVTGYCFPSDATSDFVLATFMENRGTDTGRESTGLYRQGFFFFLLHCNDCRF